MDVVKNDANTTVTEIDIVGYASPEGRYAANARLAQDVYKRQIEFR